MYVYILAPRKGGDCPVVRLRSVLNGDHPLFVGYPLKLPSRSL